MGKQRKTWTGEQKLRLILAALREEDSVAALARQHGISEQQIYRWKAQFLEGGSQALGRTRGPRADQRLQNENEQLKKLLGEKTLEIDILKKLSSLCVWLRWQQVMSRIRRRSHSEASCA
jgi:transposase